MNITRTVSNRMQLGVTSDNLKNLFFLCELCKEFHFEVVTLKCINANNLKKHTLVHNGEKLFQCGTCDLSLKNKLDLKKHHPIRMEAWKRKCPECVFCEK